MSPDSSDPRTSRELQLEVDVLDRDVETGDAPEGRGRVILVVDDDADMRRYVRSCIASLAPRGTRVIEARDGAEALTRIASLRPDVVVCDLVMPELDGAALCRTLRADPASADLRILLVSGRRDAREAAREAADCGADAALPKPFNARQLCDAIEALLPPEASS